MLSYRISAMTRGSVTRRSHLRPVSITIPSRPLSTAPQLTIRQRNRSPYPLLPSARAAGLLLSTRRFSALSLPSPASPLVAQQRSQQRGSDGHSESSSSSSFSSSWGFAVPTVLIVGSALLLLPFPAPAHADTVSIPPIPVFFDPLPAPLKVEYPESFLSRVWHGISFTFRCLLRLPVLLFLWSPLVPSYLLLPSSVFYSHFKRVLEWSGPVFVKFGQWASTRPDVFSESFVHSLASLQSAVHSHSYRYTLDVIRKTFGETALHRLIVDEQLIGSGSMAQVHHGRVLSADGKTTEVAVKVLHPSTPSRIETDLFLMSLGARLLTLVPGNEFLSMPETIEQFSSLLKQHTDLTSEAHNLDVFRRNFSRWDNVHFPAPVWSFVSDKVLVEEKETGLPLNRFLETAPPVTRTTITFPASDSVAAAPSTSSLSPFYNLPSVVSTSLEPSHAESAGGAADVSSQSLSARQQEHNHHLARLGMKMFLKMMIDDNFIHSDLHPGNLLVDVKPEYLQLHPRPPGGPTLDYLLQLPSSALSLTVLDTALVTTLNDKNRRNFLALFGAIVEGDGKLAARLMAANARRAEVVNEAEYEEQMDRLVKKVPELNTASVDVGQLLQSCLNIVRHHRVKIESDFASLVMSLIVVEGVGRKLDPEMSVVKESIPVLVANPVARKILWDELSLSMFNPKMWRGLAKAAFS